MRIDGLIYITSLREKRFTHTARKSLNMFSRLVGVESLSKVVLATSKWDEMHMSELEAREELLVKNFWKVLIDEGSIVYRLDGHKASALRVVNALLPRDGSIGEILQIQRELVDESRPLDETNAGKELADEYRRLQKNARKRLEATRPESSHTIDHQDLSALETFRLEDEKNKLHVDFSEMEEREELKNFMKYSVNPQKGN